MISRLMRLATAISVFALIAGCKNEKQAVAYDVQTPESSQTEGAAGQDHSGHNHSANPHPNISQAEVGGVSPHGANPHASMPSTHPMAATGSVNPANIQWVLPNGWTGKLSEKAMIRVVDFQTPVDTINCALYSLKNESLGQNINMWRNQVGLAKVSEDELRAFMKKQAPFKTADDKQGIIIDLRSEQPSANDIAVVNAVIPIAGNDALFLKLTGKKADLDKVMDDYRKLAASISYKK